ncbi:hypothetical protein, partial [[Clostridium] polysaccharolyticum]
MKLQKTLAAVMAFSTMLSSVPVSIQADEIVSFPPEESEYCQQDEPIITINGCGYTAQQFVERVLAYTIVPDPIVTMETEDGTEMEFEYNEERQRTEKIVGQEITTYQYDEFSNLVSEVLPDKKQITYSYTESGSETNAYSISYCNVTYKYCIQNGIITGLVDRNNKTICTYDYDKNGTTRHIYEIRGKKKIEHKDNSGDMFVGCVNSLRYDGECYDPETDLFCIQAGSYYDPKKNKIVDDTCYVDMEGLFGDQYERLSREKSTEADKKKVSPLSLPGTLESQLLYAATKKYNAALSTNVDAYKGDTWYTDFSSPAMHYKLAARIIYAENTNTNNNANMKTYLHYNRQGIAWVIINRLLEDKYRKMKGQTCTFSSTSTPNLYSILTKSGAFASLTSGNAKDKINFKNEAYREAFMLACLINVCGSF